MFGKKEDIEKEIEKIEGEAISSIIDATMTVTGEISFKGKTRIDGEINGNIVGEHLILSKNGKIQGDLKVNSFICQGSFSGNVDTKMLTARRGCSIQGKIIAGSLTVEPGASLDGEIKAATKDLQSKTSSQAPSGSDKTAATAPPKTESPKK